MANFSTGGVILHVPVELGQQHHLAAESHNSTVWRFERYIHLHCILCYVYNESHHGVDITIRGVVALRMDDDGRMSSLIEAMQMNHMQFNGVLDIILGDQVWLEAGTPFLIVTHQSATGLQSIGILAHCDDALHCIPSNHVAS
jgi:hypothetical protein